MTFEGKYNRLMAAFLRRTLNARRAWHRAFWVLTENNHQPRLLYPAGLPFTLSEKSGPSVIRRPEAQQMLMGPLHPETEGIQ